jgi:hypothetical protein
VKRPPPTPPHPELLRTPQGRFGWLEDRLLHEGWLAELGADAVSVLVLLALAADRGGASFFSRARMQSALRLDDVRLERALARLLELHLVAHRPWRPGLRDGVWQLLPLPRPQHEVSQRTDHGPLSIAQILGMLGLAR